MKDKFSSLLGVLIVLAIFLGLGPGCAAYGVHKLVAGPGDVKCGGEVMHDGQTCREKRNGSSVGAKSYTEVRDEHYGFMNRILMPVISTLVGGTVTILGLWFVWKALQNRRRQPPQPAGP